MSLVALAVQPEDSPSADVSAAGAADVTEVLTQQLSNAKTGTKAPINTPIDTAGQWAPVFVLG